MLSQENKIACVEDFNRFSWKPIFAGALVAIGLSFLLNLFGTAIGLSSFNVDSTTGAETVMFGGLLGTCIGIIVSMFAAGWISGYLAKSYCHKQHLGALYGFLTWAVALVLTMFLATQAQSYISFYSHAISGAVGPLNATVSTPSNVDTTKLVTVSTYILFILFFLSAFACSLGGHCGMCHTCKNDSLSR